MTVDSVFLDTVECLSKLSQSDLHEVAVECYALDILDLTDGGIISQCAWIEVDNYLNYEKEI